MDVVLLARGGACRAAGRAVAAAGVGAVDGAAPLVCGVFILFLA